MLTYHFTNDTRYESLVENLISVSKYIETQEWEHSSQSYDQAKNGWIQVMKFYFGLYEGATNVELINQGRINDVLVEFAKKFQFPNPREVYITEKVEKKNVKVKLAMTQEIENNQQIAPLRTLIQLLFFKCMSENLKQASMTNDEFKKYILLNDSVAKNNFNIESLYLEWKNKTLDSVNKDFNYYGGADDKKRFINQLFGFIEPLPYITWSKYTKLFTLNLENLTDLSKNQIFDIVTYNKFIDFEHAVTSDEAEKKYLEYVQMDFEGLTESNLEEIPHKKLLTGPIQKIYFGPPGTGKSYSVTKLLKNTYSTYEENRDNPYVFRTAIHPEFTYFDFVGNIMPLSKNKGDNVEISYEFQEGIFTSALKKAFQTDKDVFLVLEEMSRGNIVAVFGDIFQLLDRNENGSSEYTIDIATIQTALNSEIPEWNNRGVFLPENLHIIGTVNTSDQNVFVMDNAFKRRFDFEYIDTDPVPNKNLYDFLVDDSEIAWNEFYLKLNDFIVEDLELSEDKQIGQFFIKFKSPNNEEDIEKFKRYNEQQLSDKLLQYLWNDVHLVKMNGNSLFDSEIKSFGQLYKKCKLDGFSSVLSKQFKERLMLNS